MPKSYYASINQPVALDQLLTYTRLLMKQTLQLDNATLIPPVKVRVSYWPSKGPKNTEIRDVLESTEQLSSLVLGDQSTIPQLKPDQSGSLRRIFGLKPKAPVLSEISASITWQENVGADMQAQSVEFIVYSSTDSLRTIHIAPLSRGSTAMTWATFLCISVAKLGKGGVTVDDYWRNFDFSWQKNQDGFLALIHALDIPKQKDFKESCDTFYKALVEQDEISALRKHQETNKHG